MSASPTPRLLVGARNECAAGARSSARSENVPRLRDPRLPARDHERRPDGDRERRDRGTIAAGRDRDHWMPPPAHCAAARDSTKVDLERGRPPRSGGYSTFMMKEIHEQAGRRRGDDHRPAATEIDEVDLERASADRSRAASRGLRRIVIVACGTSYHAGLVGRYAIETLGARYRSRWTSPPSTAIATRSSARGTWSSASPSRARPPTPWRRCGWRASVAHTCSTITNVMGSQATREAHSRPVHPGGAGDRGRGDEDLHVAQVAAIYLLGAEGWRGRVAALSGARKIRRADSPS